MRAPAVCPRSRGSPAISASSLPIPKPAPKAVGEPWWRSREFILVAALVVLTLGVGLIRPGFLQPANLRDIVANAAIPMTAAAGMTALIVAAQIDISIGAILAVCAITVAYLANQHQPVPVLILAGAVVGGLLGSVNGALSAGLRIPSIVATLATMGAIRGILVFLTRGDTVPVPQHLTDLGNAEFLFLPFPVWIAAAVCVGASLYLARTRLGRQHYAVGSNPRSSELSGIPVSWVNFRSFVLLGALTGVGGFLYVCRFSPVSPSPQPGFELEVITAVVVGGTDIFGGRGTVLGAALAAILLSAIRTALPFVASFAPGLRSEIQPAVQGLLILAAVLYDSLSRKEREA